MHKECTRVSWYTPLHLDLEKLTRSTEYAKALIAKLKETGKTEEAEKFQASAAGALKKILGGWDNYDVYISESADPGEPSMWVLVNYREDGVTPYGTFWKYGVSEMKV